MKKVIILFVLTPIISFSQTYHDSALDFQNNIRSYYNLNPYTIDSNLNEQAQTWAEQMAITDEFDLSTDNLGETIYYFRKTTNSYRPNDMFLDAAVSWIVDADEAAFNQTILFRLFKCWVWCGRESRVYLCCS